MKCSIFSLLIILLLLVPIIGTANSSNPQAPQMFISPSEVELVPLVEIKELLDELSG